jgi:antitoxin (DNA-binding transcriptional repressor) of toxin-antitoxin stability system
MGVPAMKFATVREFKSHATQYLRSREDVYVTRHGKAIAVVSPVRPKSIQAALVEMRRVMGEAGLTKKKLAGLLDEARREVYPH